MAYDWKIGTGLDRWENGKSTPSQILTLSDWDNLFILQSGAYRSGKTESGARAAIRHALSFDRAKVGIFRQHLASLKRSTLLTTLELIPREMVADFNNSELVLQLVNGSVIGFYGCDFIDRLGSIELTFAFVDEVSEITQDALGMIQGRLSGQLYPSTIQTIPEKWREYAEATQGIRQVFLATNPKSQGHWLYQDFIKEPKPGYVLYSSNSLTNPNLPDTYIRSMLAASVRPGISLEWVTEQITHIRDTSSDGLYLMPHLTPFGQRNLLGMWVNLEGAIYELDAKTHLTSQKLDPEEFFMGVDWGYANPRIVILAARDDHYQMVYGWHQKNTSPDEVVEEISKLAQRFDVSGVFMPPDQPGLIKQVRSLIGGTGKKAKNAVNPGIGVVSKFLNQSRLTFLEGAPGVELAWSEMSGYAWDTDKDGQFLDKPVKSEDHYPDAIRYVLYSLHYRGEKGEPKEDDFYA